jgi:cytochrome c553
MQTSQLAFGALLFAGLTAVDAAPPSVSAGAKKSEVCQGCHGANGISADDSVPKLAGQYSEYIVKQIFDFQIQSRRDERMSPMAGTVTSVEDARDIAAYFSSQTPMRGKPNKSKNAQLGKQIYDEGIPERNIEACARCHGPDGKGKWKNYALFPVIGGQHKAYLLKQLEDFKTSRRATDASGVMTLIGRNLKKAELDALTEYIAGL